MPAVTSVIAGATKPEQVRANVKAGSVGADGGRPGRAARAALIADADDVELVRTLFREYADSLGVDLSFQGFEEELAALPGGYDVVLVARLDGEPAGCVGVRPLEPGSAR